MNRVLTFAVMAAATLAMGSCVEDAYPGQIFDPEKNGIVVPSNDEYVNLEKIPIKVRASYQEFFSLSSRNAGQVGGTRGSGPLDTKGNDRDQYLETPFYIYAFRAANDANIYPKNATMYRMDNAHGQPDLSATAYAMGRTRDTDRNNCLVDGSDYQFGAPYKFNPDGEGVFLLQTGGDAGREAHAEDTLFYSGVNRGVGYNFFAYCIDKLPTADVNPTRTRQGITYDVPIDGTTDIIMGSALPLTDSLATADYKWLANDVAMRDSILSMNGGYSTASGRASVEPRIVLKHQLTRLQFDLYPGDSVCKGMVVTGMRIKTPATGKMTVAGPRFDSYGISFDWSANNMTTVELLDDVTNPSGLTKGGSTEFPGGYEIGWDNSWLTKYTDANGEYAPTKNTDNRVPIGTGDYKACFLVPPSRSYDGELTYKLKRESEAIKSDYGQYGDEIKMDFRLEFTDKNGNSLSSQYGFEAGTIYNVKLILYGLREMQVSASIEGGKSPGWDDAGKVDDSTEDWTEK